MDTGREWRKKMQAGLAHAVTPRITVKDRLLLSRKWTVNKRGWHHLPNPPRARLSHFSVVDVFALKQCCVAKLTELTKKDVMFIFEAPAETAHSNEEGREKKGEGRVCTLESLVSILVLQTAASLLSSTSVPHHADSRKHKHTHICTPSCFSLRRLVASSSITSPCLTELFTLGSSTGPFVSKATRLRGSAGFAVFYQYFKVPQLDRKKFSRYFFFVLPSFVS